MEQNSRFKSSDARVQRNEKSHRLSRALLSLALTLLLVTAAALPVSASNHLIGDERNPWDETDFEIDALLSPSPDANSYCIEITVENFGRDFEGCARVMIDDYYAGTAYDTVISLPQGGKKRFTVRVPKNSIEINSSSCTMHVFLYDLKNNQAAYRKFNRFLLQEEDMLSLGILSDDYGALTFLDMGGDSLYFYGTDYPLRLVELRTGGIVDVLDSLTLLVIDSFDTAVLTDSETDAIISWVQNGGVLILGTGAYGEKTLSAFQSYSVNGNILNAASMVSLIETVEAGEEPTQKASIAQQQNMYLASDLLTMSYFEDQGSAMNSYYGTGSLGASQGDGSVCIVPYSLAEVGTLPAESFWDCGDRTNFIRNVLENAASDANSRYIYNNGSGSDIDYYAQRIFNVLGNSTSSLNLNVLKILLVLYVIIIGPVLYLILRKLKKAEIYWLAVPVSALLMIGVVYFAGRGFEVVSTKVYSVSLADASGQRDTNTFLLCYDAGHKEWGLRLSDEVVYAGPVFNRYHNVYVDEGSYCHHIVREGNTTTIGVKPSASFENVFFQTVSRSRESGDGFQTSGVFDVYGSFVGTVTNRTDRDFTYLAVRVGDDLVIYKDVKDGDVIDLSAETPLYDFYGSYNIGSKLLYDLLRSAYDEDFKEDAPTLAALGIAICASYQLESDSSSTGMVIGVTRGYESVVDDSCSEMSFGCLYTEFRP